MKRIILIPLLFAGVFSFAQKPDLKPVKEQEIKLPSNIKYVDTNDDEQISNEEALLIFDQYLNSIARDLKSDLVDDVESAVIDLIGFMEGVSCSDIKKTVAAKRFIEIYYINKFHSKDEGAFGVKYGFPEGDNPLNVDLDSVGAPVPAESITDSQTSLFDKYFNVAGFFTAIYQSPLGYKYPVDNTAWKNEMLVVATISADMRLWKGAEFNFTPEYAGGNGVGDGAGLAGYPNALFGFPQTYPYFLKLQFKQQFILHDDKTHRLQSVKFLLGRYILQDAFDLNPRAGDPKKDFFNFNHTMLSAWDAATTAYGYTHGGAVRINFRKTQVNLALATVNKEGGGINTDWNVKEGYSLNAQFVKRFEIGSKSGSLRFLGFYNNVYSGKLNNFLTDTVEGISYFSDSLKAYRAKYGFGFDFEIALTEDLAIFARYSWNDGKTESMGYTQADEAYNVGITYSLGRKNRPDDLLGVSASLNQLSMDHRNYLAHGGTGFMIGDGSLNYKPEIATEIFYKINLLKNFDFTLNYQYILNAAYNKDRGNMHVAGCRVHFFF